MESSSLGELQRISAATSVIECKVAWGTGEGSELSVPATTFGVPAVAADGALGAGVDTL
jgi:hypothetical protein